jgi:hypothetical protein
MLLLQIPLFLHGLELLHMLLKTSQVEPIYAELLHCSGVKYGGGCASIG